MNIVDSSNKMVTISNGLFSMLSFPEFPCRKKQNNSTSYERSITLAKLQIIELNISKSSHFCRNLVIIEKKNQLLNHEESRVVKT